MLYPLKRITNNTIDQVACTCLRTMASINKQSLSCAISLMQLLTKKKERKLLWQPYTAICSGHWNQPVIKFSFNKNLEYVHESAQFEIRSHFNPYVSKYY